MLYAHPKVDPEPARVRLTALAAYSVDVEIFAYVHARDYHEFLEIQEDLLLRCMEIVEKSGSGFAFPSQTLYLGRDGGPRRSALESGGRDDAAARRGGELEVPRFRPETIRELRGTIPYPPPGSSVGGKPQRAENWGATMAFARPGEATYISSSRGCAVRQENNSRGLIDLEGAVPGRARGSGHTAPTYASRFPGSKLQRPRRPCVLAPRQFSRESERLEGREPQATMLVSHRQQG